MYGSCNEDNITIIEDVTRLQPGTSSMIATMKCRCAALRCAHILQRSANSDGIIDSVRIVSEIPGGVRAEGKGRP